MGSLRWGFLIADVMFLAAFISMIQLVFTFSGLAFFVTFSFMLLMMLFVFLSMAAISRDAKWGWTLSMPAILVLLLFSLLVYSTKGLSNQLETMIVSLTITFVLAIINVRITPEEGGSAPPVEVYGNELEKVEPPAQKRAAARGTAKKKSAKRKENK